MLRFDDTSQAAAIAIEGPVPIFASRFVASPVRAGDIIINNSVRKRYFFIPLISR
jgi:hypothetical protein